MAARAADGAITVLVLHRFSTVRIADLIVVLDGGRIRESGCHEDLMARGGLYTELYSLQARAYRGSRVFAVRCHACASYAAAPASVHCGRAAGTMARHA